MSRGDIVGRRGIKGEITEAPPPQTSRLLAPPPLASPALIPSLMMSQGSGSDGEVGVFTSQIVINGPPVMTPSVVDSGIILTCLPILILAVVMVILELSSLVVMVMTLPEAVS